MVLDWRIIAKDQRLADLRLPSLGRPLPAAEAKSLAALMALKGLGKVAPNPLVGAVLVDSTHDFLGAGAHERLGEPHAEIMALEAVQRAGLGERLRGSTLYVTLEPCAHHGRTPACAPRLVAAGIARVIYGVRDPNPQVDGKGEAILRAAGVDCEHDPTWEGECAELAEIFLWNVKKGRPFVALKVATSLDGVMAKRGDRRAFITGPRARSYGHFLRTYYDAIAVGQNTLLADNPTLDARDALTPGPTPKRIVLDPDARALTTSDLSRLKILAAEPETVLWLVADLSLAEPAARRQAELLRKRGATLLSLPVAEGGFFSVPTLQNLFGDQGITSILLEGGQGLYGSFLRSRAVQKLHLFQAPKLLGGEGSVYFSGVGGSLDGFVLDDLSFTSLASDWLIEGRLKEVPHG